MRVALVFDDGPVPETNGAFLELLAREGARVTFAQVGRHVAAHPGLARADLDAGHEIVNHSYTHPHFKDMTADAVGRE